MQTTTDRVLSMLRRQDDYYHSVEIIAAVTGLGITQVNAAVQSLESMGALKSKRARKPRGQKGTEAVYTIADKPGEPK